MLRAGATARLAGRCCRPAAQHARADLPAACLPPRSVEEAPTKDLLTSQFLTPEELRALLGNCRRQGTRLGLQTAAMITVGVYGGFRYGACLAPGRGRGVQARQALQRCCVPAARGSGGRQA